MDNNQEDNYSPKIWEAIEQLRIENEELILLLAEIIGGKT